MKIIRSSEAQNHIRTFSLSETLETSVEDKDIACTLFTVDRQYPKGNKFVMNTQSKKLIFCVEGRGLIEIKNEGTFIFKKDDAILIDVGEVYRFAAHCSLLIMCSPSWDPKKQKEVN